MTNLNQFREKITPRGINVLCQWYASKAENATIWDENNKEYIDFASGIAVLNVGHRNPRVIQAVKKQLELFTHTAYQITPYENYLQLAHKINQLAPIEGDKKTCFFTTGAEATENAIKIAKAYTKRYGIISFGGSFHGRTTLSMSLTGKVSPYKADFGISSVGIYHALFPNQMYEISTKDAMKSIEYICKSSISPYDIAAIIFEPVQGEGGFNQAPHDFVQELRKFADEYKIVLIADEVQTGFGRTGKIFAMEHYDTKVDMICMAKSMAGGFPLSGVVGKANIMDSPNPGGLGGTYAGSPIGIAAALEVINILKEDNLLERANKLGEQLKANLKTLDCKELAQVRGIGSMVAAEFFKDDKPSPEFAKAVQNYAMEEGLLLLTCGTYGNVIRFLYPLTIPDEQFTQALNILNKSIKKAIA